jgi:hypothetical protein
MQLVIYMIQVLWFVTLLDEWFLMFRRNAVPYLAQQDTCGESTMFLQKIRNHLPNDMVSHPRRMNPQLHCCKNL